MLKLFDCRSSEISGIPPIHSRTQHISIKQPRNFSLRCFLCDSQQFSRSAGVIESNEEEKTTERRIAKIFSRSRHRRMTRKRLYHSKICSRPTPHNVLGWKNMKIPSIYISSCYKRQMAAFSKDSRVLFPSHSKLPPTNRHTVIIIIITKCCVVTKKSDREKQPKVELKLARAVG